MVYTLRDHEFGILHRELEEQGALALAFLIGTLLLRKSCESRSLLEEREKSIDYGNRTLRYIDSGSRQP